MKDKSLQKSFILSVILHLILFLNTLLLPTKFRNLEESKTIEISVINPSLTQPILPQEHKDDLKQIVDQDDRVINNELDPKSKYLSKRNQIVKKQTIAKNRGEFANTNKKNEPHLNLNINLSSLLPKMNFAKAVQDKLDEEKKFDSLAIKKALKKTIDNPQGHRPQTTNEEQASQTLDYIKELDPGLETMLSTREFVYYSFYSRIRTQLHQYWGAKVREKLNQMFKQGRSLASTDDKISKLLITLNNKGHILKIQIIGNSGYQELDEAAVEAFKAAAPFPNPPAGIIEQDGTIKIRWDFVLEA